MSRLGSPQAGRRVAIAKPKNDIYVALLLIAVCAMIVGCILMALEMNSYEWSVNPKVSQATPHTVVLHQSALACSGWQSQLPCDRG